MKIGFLEIRWTDVLDIVLVAILLYSIYKIVRGSIASRVFMGYMLVYLSYLIVRALGLELLTKILEYFMGVGAIALIVLFQQEIRRFLLIIGKTTNNTFLSKFTNFEPISESDFLLKPIVEAAKTMSNEFSGGLIVIQKDDDLQKYIESGDEIDALLSKRLLITIFNQYSPLHDGAVIVSKNRIKAARCILPVSDGEDLPASFGFRHRAAVGITEITDSVVVIISEESGKISVAYDGNISQISAHNLEEELKFCLFAKK